ncbi:MAG: choice-of-anchor A family protein, partial [Polyangiaceae bacterium]|nr:choice-of-anchor A family protein [Polyangiaceae bacterium]
MSERTAVPAEATVVINVSATSINAGPGTLNTGNFPSEQILWNMPELTSFVISGTDFHGLSIAPEAAVTISNGNYIGTLIAASLTGSGSALLWAPFDGTLPF